MLPIRAFEVPNHLLIASPEPGNAQNILESAHRRGWYVSFCNDYIELPDHIRRVPAGGTLLLDTAVFSERSGIERLSHLASLPALPKTYLLTSELDVHALAVREISTAAGINITDILVKPLNTGILDQLLGA